MEDNINILANDALIYYMNMYIYFINILIINNKTLLFLVSIYQHQLQYKSCAKDIKKFARILEKLLVKMS